MKPIALTLFFLCSLFSFGQNKVTDQNLPSRSRLQLSTDEHERHKCADNVAEDLFWQKHPELLYKKTEMNERIRSRQLLRNNTHTEDRYISVVVHVVHLEGPENISDAQIHQGISDLNDAFANAGAYQTPDGVDTHIRFCLAQQDQNGMPSTGITRRYSGYTNMNMEDDDLNLKDWDRWDPTKYLNIWLVASIESSSMGNGVAGYAYLPFSHGMPEDGIVNEASWFGSSADHSKVHIHEVGHYLGLYHTFQGGCSNSDCTIDGDMVCDTPPDQSTGYSPCGVPMNTCASDSDDNSDNNPFRPVSLGGLGDQNDLVENYMDYSNQVCQTLFTHGQSQRMNSALIEVRFSLLESQGCLSACGISEIQLYSSQDDFIIGDYIHIVPSVQFIDPVEFSWTFNGAQIGEDLILDHTFSIAEIGQQYLTLTITNPTLGCSRSDSLFFYVHCNVPASVSFSPQHIEVNDVVTFTANSPDAVTYQWILDGSLAASGATFQRQFSVADGHHIYLITGNGQCTDTTAIDYFAVGDCTNGTGNHWIVGLFGGINVDFSSGTPQATQLELDSALTNFIRGAEGIATISDQNGELLFYSDGMKIFNRNFAPIYDSLGTRGSSSQAVQIIQNPSNSNEYYVFTAEDFGSYLPDSYGSGFAYIKVDMTLNNGLGGVSSEQITLLDHVAESQTAIRHCNGHDIWIICHTAYDDAFYSYLLTDFGVSAPVISHVGASLSNQNFTAGIGTMKANPQGTILAQGLSYIGMTQFFHFDASTGILLDDLQLLNANIGVAAYGVGFSADGSKLYMSNDFGSSIYQLDFSSGNPQTILNSLYEVGVSTRPYYLGQIQLAPDGKIYIAQSNSHFMDVVEHPNEPGADCGFINNGFSMPGEAIFGINNILLPRAIGAKPQIMGPTSVCSSGQNIEYTASCGANIWNVQGAATMLELSSTNVALTFTGSGNALLTCSRYDNCAGWLTDSLIIQSTDLDLDLGEDTAVCSTGTIALHAPGQYVSYLWSTGATSSTIHTDHAGVYSLQVTGIGGCTATDQIAVSYFDEEFSVPTQTIELCAAFEGYFDVVPARSDLEFHWWIQNGQTLSPLHLYNYAYQGDYPMIIYYTNEHGCVFADSVWVRQRPELPEFDLGMPMTICQDAVETIHIDQNVAPNCTYSWPDDSHGNDYSIINLGENNVLHIAASRYDPLCQAVAFDTLTVNVLLDPTLQLPDSLGLCNGSQIILNPGSQYQDVIWQDGTNAHSYVATTNGVYSISVTTPCGTYRDSTVIHDIIPSDYILDLPDTLSVCSDQLPFHVNANNNNFETYNWSSGLYGFATSPGYLTLTATYQCMSDQDSVFIVIRQAAQSILPYSIDECVNDYVNLVQPENQITTWSDGTVSDTLVVHHSGVYVYSTTNNQNCTTSGIVQVHLAEYNFDIQDTVICEGDIITIYPQVISGYFFWNYQVNPNVIQFSDSGHYAITIYNYTCSNTVQFDIDFASNETYNVGLPENIAACESDFPVSIEPDGDLALSYEWSNGSHEQNSQANDIGWLTLTAYYECGQKTDSVLVESLANPNIDWPFDSVLCANTSIILHGIDGNQNDWSTGSNASQISISSAGIYSVESTDQNGCVGSASIEITETPLFVDVSGQSIFCPGDSVEISGFSNGTSETWNTGWTENTNYTSNPGYYELQASLGNCTESEGITVEAYPNYPLDLGNDTIVNGSSITLHASGNYFNYQWSVVGQNTSSVTITNTGTYSLSVEDENGCAYSDNIHVSIISTVNELANGSMLFIPQNFSAEVGLHANAKNVAVKSVAIFDDLGRLISKSSNNTLLWDGRVNGSQASTGMYFYVVYYTDSTQREFVTRGKSLLMD